MSALEWNDSLELGLEPMDATHREFVECYQALAAAARSSYLNILQLHLLIDMDILFHLLCTLRTF